MKRLIGLALSLALGLAAVAAPVAANSDNATDVVHGVVSTGVACRFGDLGIGIGLASTEESLHQWHGDNVSLTCWFKDLDMSGWDGTKLVEGFQCGIASNPDPPYQGIVVTTDTSFRVNAQGNAVMRCDYSPLA
jgi:hypothetical protein